MKKKSNAVSLVEVLIATTMFVVISIALYSLLYSGIQVKKRVELEQIVFKDIYLGFSRVEKEVRCNIKFLTQLPAISGDNKQIKFYASVFDYTKNIFLISLIIYELEDDCFWRREYNPFNQKLIKEFPVLRNLFGLEIFYYSLKDNQWVDQWDDNKNIPSAIRILVKKKSEKKKEVEFDKYIYLYQG